MNSQRTFCHGLRKRFQGSDDVLVWAVESPVAHDELGLLGAGGAAACGHQDRLEEEQRRTVAHQRRQDGRCRRRLKTGNCLHKLLAKVVAGGLGGPPQHRKQRSLDQLRVCPLQGRSILPSNTTHVRTNASIFFVFASNSGRFFCSLCRFEKA